MIQVNIVIDTIEHRVEIQEIQHLHMAGSSEIADAIDKLSKTAVCKAKATINADA